MKANQGGYGAKGNTAILQENSATNVEFFDKFDVYSNNIVNSATNEKVVLKSLA